MKKFSLVAAALIAGVALNVNAATVATVNGKSISDAEVSEFVLCLEDRILKLCQIIKKALIQQYIMQDLILQDAKNKFRKDPLYTKELDRAKDAILVNVYQEKILNTIKIDAAKVKAFMIKIKTNM